MLEIYSAAIEKASYVGRILPALKEFRRVLEAQDVPMESFMEEESSLAKQIQSFMEEVGRMDRDLDNFYNRAELAEIDFDAILYQGIKDHNKREKNHPFDPLEKARSTLKELSWQKEHLDRQTVFWLQKEAEFMAAKNTKQTT